MLWGLAPVEQPSASALVGERLRNRIHLGFFSPGERLPAERRLAEDMAVSRETLREALAALEGEGYLEIRRGAAGGSFVCGAEELGLMRRRRLGRDPGLVLRALEALEILAVASAGGAAARRSATDLRQLRLSVQALAEAQDPVAGWHAETQLILALGEASQNPFLARAMEQSRASLFAPGLPLADFGPVALARGADLLRAITARDRAQAESLALALAQSERQRFTPLLQAA